MRGSTLDVKIQTTDVRFWRLKSIPALEGLMSGVFIYSLRPSVIRQRPVQGNLVTDKNVKARHFL